MVSSKYFDRIVAAVLVLAVALTVLMMNGEALGLYRSPAEAAAPDYDTLLFDDSFVHSIDISMPDWEDFTANCTDEKYGACTVTVDGETLEHVGIRAKGNGSVFAVVMMDSSRFSFKLEFDHFLENQSYHGLDKLNLNNLVQDATYMKDALAYHLMREMDVPAPLCSYVFVTVNGEDWGLYLAVEGLEDGFMNRSFGAEHGLLYKPDSQGMNIGFFAGIIRRLPKDFTQRAEEADPEQVEAFMERFGLDELQNDVNMLNFAFLGYDAPDLRLQYSGERPKDYENIFSKANTRIGKGDMARLIASLRRLSAFEDLEHTVDTDEVIRYFAVHNFLVNSDSYTGSSVHNYYLYETDGLLSMLPWDYNLAYGTFLMDAKSAVNDPIDTPLSVSGDGSRPMFDFILRDASYTAQYHEQIRRMLGAVDMDAYLAETERMISEYVRRDPTKFVSYEEFEAGAQMLRLFCRLRRESVEGQLAGLIPADREGQAEHPELLLSPDGLVLHTLGDVTMGMGIDGWEAFTALSETADDRQE